MRDGLAVLLFVTDANGLFIASCLREFIEFSESVTHSSHGLTSLTPFAYPVRLDMVV